MNENAIIVRGGFQYTPPYLLNLIELLEFLNLTEKKRDIPYYIKLLSERFNSVDTEGRTWTVENTTKFLEILYDVDTPSVFNLLLKEIAVDLDKKYDDHILNSETLYVVDSHNGEIVQVSTDQEINVNTIALFRTFEDAKLALTILEDLHYVVYDK